MATTRRLILHVGMHKTGTTSIQMSLNGLSEGGVRYMDLGSSNHTGPISAAFAGDPKEDGNRLRMGRTPEQMAAVRRRTLERLHADFAQDFHTYIISGEGLVHLSQGSLDRLRDTLMKHVDRVDVFAYVRDPVGYSTSAFQERTKGGYAGHELTRADYRLKFAPMMHTFGRDHVTLKEFARPALRDGSAVVDFCHLWGIPFDPKREVRSNESLSEPTVRLVHLFNQSGKVAAGSRELKRARLNMIKAINGHFQGKFELPEAFRVHAIDTEDIAWLEENFNIHFAVPPAPRERMSTAEFGLFLERIEPAVVASYAQFVGGLGIATSPADTAAELLQKHFAHCVAAQAAEPVAPKSPLTGLRKRLRAGVRGLSR